MRALARASLYELTDRAALAFIIIIIVQDFNRLLRGLIIVTRFCSVLTLHLKYSMTERHWAISLYHMGAFKELAGAEIFRDEQKLAASRVTYY